MDDTPRNTLSYDAALHGVQAGAGLDLHRQYPNLSDEEVRRLKHLRVGIDSAMVNDAALVRLLVKKGLITEAEYAEEVRLEANRELDRYEDRLSAAVGSKITLR